MRVIRSISVVTLAVLLGSGLAACDPTPAPEPEPTSSGSATPSTSAEPTPDPTASEEPEPEPDPGLGASDRANIRDAIESSNTAALEGYFSDPVRVIIMSSECCWDVTPAHAVESLSYIAGAAAPWDWNLPASTIADWRANEYYGYLFTGDDVTGLAADGTVVSFGIVGDRITTVLMGFAEGFTY